MTKSPFFGRSRPAALRHTSTASNPRHRTDSVSSQSTALETPEKKLANLSKELSSPPSSPPPPLRYFDFSQQHTRRSTLPTSPRLGGRGLRIPKKLASRIPKRLVHQDDSWIARAIPSFPSRNNSSAYRPDTSGETRRKHHQSTQSVTSCSDLSDSSEREREKLTPLPLRVRKLPGRSAFESRASPSYDLADFEARALQRAGLIQQKSISSLSISPQVDDYDSESFEQFAERFESGRKTSPSATDSEPDSLHTPKREDRHRKLTLETLTNCPVCHEERAKHISSRDLELQNPMTVGPSSLNSAILALTTDNTTGPVIIKSNMGSLRPESAVALTAHRREAIRLAKTQASVVAEKCKRSNQEVPGYAFDELIGKGSFGRVYKG